MKKGEWIHSLFFFLQYACPRATDNRCRLSSADMKSTQTCTQKLWKIANYANFHSHKTECRLTSTLYFIHQMVLIYLPNEVHSCYQSTNQCDQIYTFKCTNCVCMCVYAGMFTNRNKWVLNVHGKTKSIDWSFGFWFEWRWWCIIACAMCWNGSEAHSQHRPI